MQSISELPFIGGDVALDFVNTAEERGHPDADDALRSAAELGLWGRRYGLLTRASARGDAAEREFETAREARELLYALLHDHVQGRPAPRAALARLGELAAEAYRAGSLEARSDGSLRWRWRRTELSTIRHVAVTSALELLQKEPARRLKQCPGEHCGWFFLDTTKRGNRRWCSMGECGQEAKNLKRRKAV